MESWSHISRSTLLATFTGQKDMDSRQIQLPTPWCHLLSVPCTSMRSGRGFPTAAKRIANRLGRQVERTKLPTCTEGLPVDHDCCGPEVIYQPGTEPMELALRTQEDHMLCVCTFPAWTSPCSFGSSVPPRSCAVPAPLVRPRRCGRCTRWWSGQSEFSRV